MTWYPGAPHGLDEGVGTVASRGRRLVLPKIIQRAVSSSPFSFCLRCWVAHPILCPKFKGGVRAQATARWAGSFAFPCHHGWKGAPPGGACVHLQSWLSPGGQAHWAALGPQLRWSHSYLEALQGAVGSHAFSALCQLPVCSPKAVVLLCSLRFFWSTEKL